MQTGDNSVYAERRVVLCIMWHLPDGDDPILHDREYHNCHVPLLRRLPGVQRHVALKGLNSLDTVHPSWWRGDDLWFPSTAVLASVMQSTKWKHMLGGYLCQVAGLQLDAFEVEDEYITPYASRPGAGFRAPMLLHRGTWHIPGGRPPEESDTLYFSVHVPLVRSAPFLHRHVVLKSIPLPGETTSRSWRGAEVWHDLRAETAFIRKMDDIKHDGFTSLVAGLQLDAFAVEEEVCLVP